jgi:hypothetical protein
MKQDDADHHPVLIELLIELHAINAPRNLELLHTGVLVVANKTPG